MFRGPTVLFLRQKFLISRNENLEMINEAVSMCERWQLSSGPCKAPTGFRRVVTGTHRTSSIGLTAVFEEVVVVESKLRLNQSIESAG